MCSSDLGTNLLKDAVMREDSLHRDTLNPLTRTSRGLENLANNTPLLVADSVTVFTGHRDPFWDEQPLRLLRPWDSAPRQLLRQNFDSRHSRVAFGRDKVE